MASPRHRLEILTESSSYSALVMRLAAEAYTPQYWMLRALAAESSGESLNHGFTHDASRATNSAQSHCSFEDL